MLTKDESSPLPLLSVLRLSSSLSLHLREKETPIPSSSPRFLSSSATFWVSEKTQIFWASSLLRLLVLPRAVSMAGRYDKNPFDEEEVNPFAVSIFLSSRCSFCTVACFNSFRCGAEFEHWFFSLSREVIVNAFRFGNLLGF